MAVPIALSPTVQSGPPVPLFSVHPAGSVLEVADDGKRLLIENAADDSGSPPIDLLLNWTQVLKPDEPAR